MKTRTRGILLGLGVLVLLGAVAFLMRSSGGKGAGAAGDGGGTAGAVTGQSGPAARPGTREEDRGAAAPPGATARSGEVVAELGWGSGPSELGRKHAEESNPEAPMSLAVDALGGIVVLDQVNGRLVRLDSAGKVAGTLPVTQQVPQDVTVSRDGTLLVLDRLKDKSVALLNPDTGQLIGELPVEGKGIPMSSAVTSTFVDGDSVYVEREHGALVRIGDLSGRADAERPELPGRPSRDGRSFLSAAITDRGAGRVVVNAIDRQSGQHRYTREYRLEFPLMFILLLDTDRSGLIYLGVMGELPTGKAEPAVEPGVRLFCLDALDGRMVGQANLPANTLPEETFRDFAVLDEGGVIYKHVTKSGVTLQRAHCR
ncbi:MAG TPA: hypothetical protein VF664_09805 [Cystobacter sp.]